MHLKRLALAATLAIVGFLAACASTPASAACTPSGSWLAGTFHDGFPLCAADLNSNNTYQQSTILAQIGNSLPTGVKLTSPNLQGNTALMQGTATVIFAPDCNGVTGATWLIGTDQATWCSHATTGATDNLSDGTITLDSLTTGFGNMAFGSEVMHNLTTGSNNACFGFEACHALTTGGNNDAVGFDALAGEHAGSNNVAFGQGALPAQNGGSSNIGIGPAAGPAVSTAQNDICIGAAACPTHTSGNKNIAIGTAAGYGISTGHGNVWIGGQGPTLSDQNDSVTLADGDGNVAMQYLPGNGYIAASHPLSAPLTTLMGQGAPSNFAVGSASHVGSGATVACATFDTYACDGVSGTVRLVTGTGSANGGQIFSFNLPGTWNHPPNCVTGPLAVDAFSSGVGPVVYMQPNLVSGVASLNFFATGALFTSTAYLISYVCGGN
ncbi:MAG: hypothetical protein ACXWCO_00650 [Caldimonas sp.]